VPACVQEVQRVAPKCPPKMSIEDESDWIFDFVMSILKVWCPEYQLEDMLRRRWPDPRLGDCSHLNGTRPSWIS
jgi:hypothetical protein